MNGKNKGKGEKTAVTIRQADLRDARPICALIKSNPLELIVRPLGDIVRNIDRFTVASSAGKIVACASYTVWPEPGDFEKSIVELTSVVVRDELRGKGFGAAFVRQVVRQVSRLNPGLIIVLTYTPAFFAKLGFTEIPKTEIMHKIYAGCVNCTKQVNPFTCPETAMGLAVSAFGAAAFPKG